MSWDKRQLRHTAPCADCPFRRTSLPGYLGGYGLEPYRQPPSAGIPTTCHCSDHGATSPRSSLCAGSLAVIAADPEVQPLPEYAEAVRQVSARPDCHGSVEAFARHHRDAHKFVVPRSLRP